MSNTETLFAGQWLRIKRRGTWEFAERTNRGGGAVIVIAETAEGKVVFVEQFRVPINARTIEMPAGLIGDDEAADDDDILATARRELIEETGYDGDSFEHILTGPTSAGMSNEMVGFVLARGLRRVGAGGGVDGENITVHEVLRGDAAEWLLQKQSEGFGIDLKLFAGLWFLERA